MNFDAGLYPAVILSFAMPTCHQCHRMLPVLVSAAEARRHDRRKSFYVYQPGMNPPPDSVPILVLDVSVNDEAVQGLATRFEIVGTPVTIVLPRGGAGIMRRDGAMTPEQISALLDYAESFI